MSKDSIQFEEKQYLGHNRFSIVIRTVLTLFCFLGYYWSENPKPVKVSFFTIGSYPISSFSNSGLVFFVLGLSILILSAALTYVLHMHTVVYRDRIELRGFWTSRKISLYFEQISHVRRSRYKKNFWKRTSYNLHNRGVVRFYTSGEDFVELIDSKGFTYRIGSHRAEELHKILRERIK